MLNDLLKFFSLFLLHEMNPNFLQVATQHDKIYTAAGIPLVFKAPDRLVSCSSVPKRLFPDSLRSQTQINQTA